MDTKRTHIVIPQQLAVEIDTLVGKRDRSAFLTQAAEKELMRLRQIKALEGAAGAWKDKDHSLYQYHRGLRRHAAEGTSSQHPDSPTPCAIRLHAPRRCPCAQNGIILNPLPPFAVRSQHTSPDLCHGAHAACVDSYNTVVLSRRGGTAAKLRLSVDKCRYGICDELHELDDQ